MSPNDDRTELCARVLDRLVEGGDVAGDPLLGEHLGSCVTCFRAMTELRDAPRVAEALRAEMPALPRAADRFWDELAERTTDAALAALGDGARVKTTAPSTAARARRSAGARTRIFSVAATLAMAAAGFLLVGRHSNPAFRSPASVAPGLVARGDQTVASAARTRPDDPTSDEEADVADLDAGGLRRLLDRLRPSAPAALTASGAGGDSADVIGDDEGRVNEELADLDGDELRRVARSLTMGAL
jgi:hypothetical protein